MRSFPVPVLSFAVRFLLPFPASLPQLFHRCLVSAFASSFFRFPSASFRPLPFPFRLLSLLFFLSALPASASQGLPPCALPLSLLRFPRSSQPGFPCFLPRFPYSAFCWFPFVLPCFAPAAVPQVIPFQISPPGPVPDFRFLSSASVLASHYSASVSSFPCFLSQPHSGFLNASDFPLGLSVFHRIFRQVSPTSLPVSGTRLPVRSLSPLPDSLPQLLVRCFPFAFAFGLVRFASGSFRPLLLRFRLLSLLFLPFRSSRFRLSVASPVPPLRFRFLAFPVLPGPVSRAFFPGFRTRLSACFLSSFPASLPAAVPPVLTSCSRFRYPSFFFRFLSSASFPDLTTQPLPFLFPSSRFPLAAVHSGACLSSFRSAWSPMLPFPIRYSASCSSFLLSVLASQAAFRTNTGLSLRISAGSP